MCIYLKNVYKDMSLYNEVKRLDYADWNLFRHIVLIKTLVNMNSHWKQYLENWNTVLASPLVLSEVWYEVWNVYAVITCMHQFKGGLFVCLFCFWDANIPDVFKWEVEQIIFRIFFLFFLQIAEMFEKCLWNVFVVKLILIISNWDLIKMYCW